MFQLVPFLLRKEYGGGSYPSACPIMPVLGKGPEGQPAFPFSGKTEKNEYSCQHLNGVMILPGKALSDCLYETCQSSLHVRCCRRSLLQSRPCPTGGSRCGGFPCLPEHGTRSARENSGRQGNKPQPDERNAPGRTNHQKDARRSHQAQRTASA